VVPETNPKPRNTRTATKTPFAFATLREYAPPAKTPRRKESTRTSDLVPFVLLRVASRLEKTKPPNNTKLHEKKHKQIPLRLRATAVNLYLPQRRQDAKKAPGFLILSLSCCFVWLRGCKTKRNSRLCIFLYGERHLRMSTARV
jgi:hypothetical protein